MRQPCSVAATMASMCRECRCEANRILNRVGLVTGEKAEIEIMAFFASPTGGGQVPELPLMREIQVLLRDIPASQQSVVPAPRWPLDVHSGLRKEAPRVLQFSGHTARGSLCFHSAAAEGLASLPDWRGWHDVLGRNKAERLEGVVLNACSSLRIAVSIVRHRSTSHLQAVCWATKVESCAATHFMHGFYKCIADEIGCPIERAFAAGRDRIETRFVTGDPEEYLHPPGHDHDDKYDPKCPGCKPPCAGIPLLLSKRSWRGVLEKVEAERKCYCKQAPCACPLSWIQAELARPDEELLDYTAYSGSWA